MILFYVALKALLADKKNQVEAVEQIMANDAQSAMQLIIARPSNSILWTGAGGHQSRHEGAMIFSCNVVNYCD